MVYYFHLLELAKPAQNNNVLAVTINNYLNYLYLARDISH